MFEQTTFIIKNSEKQLYMSELFENVNNLINIIEKSYQKERINYLMKYEHELLWNIFNNEFNGKLPSSLELKGNKIVKSKLDAINEVTKTQTKIIWNDVYYIFSKIFVSRKNKIVKPLRSKDEWAKIFPRYPVNSDGFAKSFDAYNNNEWMPVLNKYGCVVIKGVLSQDECDKTVKAMINELNARAKAKNGILYLCFYILY